MKKRTLILALLTMLGLSSGAFAGETEAGMAAAQDAVQAATGAEQKAEANATDEANATQPEQGADASN